MENEKKKEEDEKEGKDKIKGRKECKNIKNSYQKFLAKVLEIGIIIIIKQKMELDFEIGIQGI